MPRIASLSGICRYGPSLACWYPCWFWTSKATPKLTLRLLEMTCVALIEWEIKGKSSGKKIDEIWFQNMVTKVFINLRFWLGRLIDNKAPKPLEVSTECWNNLVKWRASESSKKKSAHMCSISRRRASKAYQTQGLRKVALVRLVNTPSRVFFYTHLHDSVDVCFNVGRCLQCLLWRPNVPTLRCQRLIRDKAYGFNESRLRRRSTRRWTKNTNDWRRNGSVNMKVRRITSQIWRRGLRSWRQSLMPQMNVWRPRSMHPSCA